MQRTSLPLSIFTAIVLLLSLLAMFLARELALFGSWREISTSTLVFIAAWYGVFLLGLLTPQPSPSWVRNPGVVSLNRWVFFLGVAATIGACLLTYEFAIVRGYGFSTEVSELRTLQVNAATAGFVGSWLGGLGRLLISAIVVAWVIACMQWASIRWKSLLVVGIGTIAVFAFQAKFEGGRIFSTATIVAALSSCMLCYVAQEGLRFRAKPMLQLSAPALLLIAMFIAVTVYNMQVFTTRADYTAGASRISESSPNISVLPTEEPPQQVTTYAKLYSDFAAGFQLDVALPPNEKFGPREYSAAMAWIYLTHGPNEFDRIYRIQNFHHAMGFYQFSQIAQILSKLAGEDLRYDLVANLPNVGTYITLPGASYLDFGIVFGLVFAAILGLGLRMGLSAAVLYPSAPIIACAPLIFIIVLAGPVTTIVPNFWPCFIWIGLMTASFAARKDRLAFS